MPEQRVSFPVLLGKQSIFKIHFHTSQPVCQHESTSIRLNQSTEPDSHHCIVLWTIQVILDLATIQYFSRIGIQSMKLYRGAVSQSKLRVSISSWEGVAIMWGLLKHHLLDDRHSSA